MLVKWGWVLGQGFLYHCKPIWRWRLWGALLRRSGAPQPICVGKGACTNPYSVLCCNTNMTLNPSFYVPVANLKYVCYIFSPAYHAEKKLYAEVNRNKLLQLHMFSYFASSRCLFQVRSGMITIHFLICNYAYHLSLVMMYEYDVS